MKIPNEYQKRIKVLNSELLYVAVTDCTSEEYRYGVNGRRTSKFKMCRINHTDYVACNDVCSRLVNRREALIDKGLFEESDFAYFVYTKGQASVFVKADKLYEVRELLSKEFSERGFYEAIIPIAVSAMKMTIPNENVDYKKFQRSQEAYLERVELMTKSKRFNVELKKLERMEREQECLENEKQEESTLRGLVSKIEAMGWNVSLSLKK